MHMTDKKIYELHAEVCKALGHPLRIEVLDVLQDKELCFTDILTLTGGLKSNLSQHLSSMTQKGILKVRRGGKCNYYSVKSEKVIAACQLMREVLVENLQEQHRLLQKIS